jgi:hypothetical protein
MGISPEKWGPILWGAIHMTCLAGSATSEFVNAFAEALPCPACSGHFKEVLTELPFPESRDPFILFEWSVNAHNRVNSRIGKPILTVEQAFKIWTEPSTKPEAPQFDFKILIIILLLTVLFFMLLKK